MTKLSDLLASRNIPLTIVVYPWAQQIAQNDRDSKQVRLWRDFCPGRCKAFIDLFPPFFAAADRDKDWYEHLYIVGDDHFSAAGQPDDVRGAGEAAVELGRVLIIPYQTIQAVRFALDSVAKLELHRSNFWRKL